MLYPTLWRASAPSLWDDVFGMRHEFDRLFDRYLTGASTQAMAAWNPVVDVRETADEFAVIAELPGLASEDVSVTVQNGVLTISGEKKQETEEGQKGTDYHIYERRYGQFERSFALPRSVVADDVRAGFQNGVLTVTLPKTAEAKPRKINVEVASGETRTQIGKAGRAA